jgi:hypothetical protein
MTLGEQHFMASLAAVLMFISAGSASAPMNPAIANGANSPLTAVCHFVAGMPHRVALRECCTILSRKKNPLQALSFDL